MLTATETMARTGIDAAALKPSECDVTRAPDLPVETVALDYEGTDHLPDAATLDRLAAATDLRVTTPVRADGFDPLGDDSALAALPEDAGRVVVAGHPAYLTPDERSRAVAPRLRATLDRTTDAWVGTEGVERVALAAGGTQFELLSGTTRRDLRALRAAGHDGELAVYAPTVLSGDDDAVLDAVGGYVARRPPVDATLPDGARTDAGTTDRAREVLLDAADDFALVGSPGEVGERVRDLKDAGADLVVGYPARGVGEFLAGRTA